MRRMMAAVAVLTIGLSANATALTLWEAGRLDYPDGNAEVAAFVNGPQGTQLQAVLCAKNESDKNRLSLLLPEFFDTAFMFEVTLTCNELQTTVYAELSGNALELQLDDDFYLKLANSHTLTLSFKPQDAAYLHLPVSIDLPLLGASEVMQQVASQCVLLCLNEDFKSREGLLSALLWPQAGFNRDRFGNVDELCTKPNFHGGYNFNFTDSCRLTLDRFYAREGQGPLSFLYALFHGEGAYQKYKTLWNDAVAQLSVGPLADLGWADDEEWYLGLYALAGTRPVDEYPQSYFNILHVASDPTTLLYDIDNRYEMETLKYVSVLMRRLQPSYQTRQALEQALNAWSDFYRQLTALQPYILKAQALRPVMYRLMLQRIWRLAGRPQGLDLRPEYAFVQGTGNKTITQDALEKKCAYFEGMRGDEFFFGSDDCIHAIHSEMRHAGLITDDYPQLLQAWDDFATAWSNSIFYSDSADDAVGEHLRSNLALTLLTACRVYGFGDYFLLRECISTRDGDICSLERERALHSLEHELSNKVNAIAAVSREDAQELQQLHAKWLNYQDKLTAYVAELERRGHLSWWRAQLVLGMSGVLQTNAVISAPYYREELPDETLTTGSEDDFLEEDPHSQLQDLKADALDAAQQRAQEREQERDKVQDRQ